jgi:hypothetical protein
MTILRKKMAHKIKFAQVKSTMTTFAKVQISFVSTQYLPMIVMTREMVSKEHEFVHARHGT